MSFIIEGDGGSRGNPGIAASGTVVCAENGQILAEIGRFLGETTNNVAEYTSVIEGLKWTLNEDSEASVHFKMDSKLVVEQLSGRWKIKDEKLRALAKEATELYRGRKITFEWVPREQNKRADAIANEAMDLLSSFSR